MNEPELDIFEKELRRLNPAHAPQSLIHRLETAERTLAPELGAAAPTAPVSIWNLAQRWVTWLGPVAAAAMVAGLLWLVTLRGNVGTPSIGDPEAAVQAATGEKTAPDALEIDRRLLVSYEAVAELPDSGPVVFRCDEWEDKVTFRDRARGILIERRTPRLEVVPVRFDSY